MGLTAMFLPSTEVEEFENLPKRTQDLTRYAIEMDGLYDLDFSVTEEKLELFPAALVYNSLQIINLIIIC